jgi:hypothetical protein
MEDSKCRLTHELRKPSLIIMWLVSLVSGPWYDCLIGVALHSVSRAHQVLSGPVCHYVRISRKSRALFIFSLNISCRFDSSLALALQASRLLTVSLACGSGCFSPPGINAGLPSPLWGTFLPLAETFRFGSPLGRGTIELIASHTRTTRCHCGYVGPSESSPLRGAMPPYGRSFPL